MLRNGREEASKARATEAATEEATPTGKSSTEAEDLPRGVFILGSPCLQGLDS